MTLTRRLALFAVVSGTLVATLPLSVPEASAADITPQSLTHEYCPTTSNPATNIIAPYDINGHFMCEVIYREGGDFDFTVPDGVSSIDVLLGGAGGGGGAGRFGTASWGSLGYSAYATSQRFYAGGGGGAGEVESHLDISVNASDVIPFSVGLSGNRGITTDNINNTALPVYVSPASKGGSTSWNNGQYTAEGGGAGGTFGFTTENGWSGGGGAGVGNTDSSTAGTSGTGGFGGGDGTSTAIACADLTAFYTEYVLWDATCPYSVAGPLFGASSNLMFVAGGGGGGNGGSGTPARVGAEPDTDMCDSAYTTVFGGNGGAPAAAPGGLFALGDSADWEFGDFTKVGYGGGGGSISPSVDYPALGTECKTYGAGVIGVSEGGSGAQLAPNADYFGQARVVKDAYNPSPGSGGGGGVAYTNAENYMDSMGTSGGSGFVVIRYLALVGYGANMNVLNEGGAQTGTDGIEWVFGGGQMQVYRYNKAYSVIGAGGCTPASCVLETAPNAPHQPQFYDVNPPEDPNADQSPNNDLLNNWYLLVVSDTGQPTRLMGPIIPNDEVPPPFDQVGWDSVQTYGGSTAADQSGGGSYTVTTDMQSGDYFMSVVVTYTDLEHEANVQVTVVGNNSTDTYRVYHIADTNLAGGNEGPGFYDDSDPAHPMVGVRTTNLDGSTTMVGLRNNGPAWSGYGAKYFECAMNGFSSDFGLPCSLDGEASNGVFRGAPLWTGGEAIDPDPSSDKGLSAMWELPADGTDTTGVIDYDIVFDDTAAPAAEGAVYIDGRTYNAAPQSCTNTPFDSLFAALDTSRSGLPADELPADAGDTVYVCPGSYFEKFTSEVAADVTVIGLDASGAPALGDDRPIISKPYDAQLSGPLLHIASGAFTLRNLVIDGVMGDLDVNSTGLDGGAISSGGTVSVYDSAIDNSFGRHGGAILATGNVRVERSTFTGNASYLTGCSGDPGCRFAGSGSAYGGAVSAETSLVTVIDSTFTANTTFGSDADGGAILADRTDISGSSFVGNGASGAGGAVFNIGLSSAASWTTRVTGSSFDGNQALGGTVGGAIDTDRALIDNSSFDGNAGYWGGAVAAQEWADITNSTFTSNTTAGEGNGGGGVFVGGEARYPDATPLLPSGTALGSGPATTGPRLNVSGSTFTSNWGSAGGALATMAAPIYVESSTFTTNHGAMQGSSGGDGMGGAIATFGAQVQVVGSTFDRNDTDNGDGIDNGSGGAILALKWETGVWDLIVTNSTFVGNSSSQGGAINAGLVKATYSTFVDNVAGSGGAVALYDTFEVANSLFVNNAVGGTSCSYTGGFTGYVDLGGNVDDDGDCTDTAGVGPIALGALADNGGPTPTMAFVPPHPASGVADCSLAIDIAIDQRGVPRTGSCDAGAYEYHELQSGPGHVYIVGRYYDGTSYLDSTDSSVGPATACDNTPYQTITDAVLEATNGDTVHVCGMSGPSTRTPYVEPTIHVYANDLTIEGDDWVVPATVPLPTSLDSYQDNRILEVEPNVTSFTIQRLDLKYGEVDYGAHIYAPTALVTVIDSSLNNGSAQESGGSIYARSVDVSSSPGFIADGLTTQFGNNVAGYNFGSEAGGGAITATDSITVNDASFYINTSYGAGGALLAHDISVDHAYMMLNSTYGLGGAIASRADDATIVVDESVLSLNGISLTSDIGDTVCNTTAFCPLLYGTGRGGAIYAAGANSRVEITSSSISLNEAYANGGGVYVVGGSLSATNTSFFANVATNITGGHGAAVATAPGVKVQLQHDSFYANVGAASAVYIEPQAAPESFRSSGSWIANSLFVDNFTDVDIAANSTCSDDDTVLADGGGNLTSDADCLGDVATAAELGLAPMTLLTLVSTIGTNLVDAGHFTGVETWLPVDLVVAPSEGSIAFDHVADVDGACAVDVDQRGAHRPQYDGCDTGAYEFGSSGPVVLYVEQHHTVGGGSCDSPDFNTVAEALAAAGPGDTIHVCEGVYREGMLVVADDDVTIEGDGPTRTIFDGEVTPNDLASRTGLLDARNGANLSISGVTFRHGHATNGAAINAGTNALTLSDVRFEDNHSDYDGGALVLGGDSTFDGVQFIGNSAGTNGGAIYTTANLTVLNSSFGGNSASDGNGGAIYASGYAVVAKNTTFSDLSANNGYGGAIYAKDITVVYVTLYDTYASLGGAGYYAEDGGSLNLTSSLTLKTNTDTDSGFACEVGIDGTITDNGANISSDSTCYDTLDASSLENVDYLDVVEPTSTAYDYWGGPTMTVKLVDATSTAIDFADCALVGDIHRDQRDIHRPQGSDCDSGAYEYREPVDAVYIVGRTWNGVTEDPNTETIPEACDNTPYSTIQGAVDAAVDGDIVHICAGHYGEHDIHWDGGTITFEGEGRYSTTIDGDAIDRVFNFPGDTVTLKSLSVSWGVVEGNGGAVLASAVHASDVRFESNWALNGGAIYVADDAVSGTTAEVTLVDCEFVGNGGDRTVFGGAVYADNGGPVYIDGSYFEDNSTISINDSSVGTPVPVGFPIESKDYAVDGSGGAVLAGSIEAVHSTFNGNDASTHGGALLAETVTVFGSTFTGNTANGFETYPGYGGAIWGSVVDVEASSFDNNEANVGGAIGVVAGPSGGSVGPSDVASGTITIDSSTFESNSSSTYGAAIYNQSGEVISTNSTYYDNSATLGGGAIQSVGNMTLTHNTFQKNSAGDLATGGGTLLTGAEVFATNNIFSYVSGDLYGYNGCQLDWTDVSKLHDLGGNLSTDDWCIGTAWTSVADFDLKDIAYNGGATRTIALGRDSVARDLTSPTCVVPADQRGVLRPAFSGCDTGAYEYALKQPDISVTAAESSIDTGASDDLSAVVSYSEGAPAPLSASTPTGQVQFYYCVPADLTSPATCADPANWTAIGSPVDLDSTGTAYYPAWTPPADATYEVHAEYLGDDNFEIADTTISGSATVVVGPQYTSIMVCIDHPSTTYGKKLSHLDVDYCVPVGECWAGPTLPGPASHDDECCTTSPTSAGDLTAQHDECCDTAPLSVSPTDADHCDTAPAATTTEDSPDTSTPDGADIVYSEVGDLWVGTSPSSEGPSAPETSSKDDGLPSGYYEVEPKEIYEHYGVIPPTCTVPDYTEGTPVSASPLEIVCEGGDAGEGYQFDYSLVDEQDFTILPAQLKVKPDEQHVTFGDPAPTYTYKVRGFKLHETPATASGWVDVVCTSDYTSSSPAGSRYAIICSGGAADNYTFKYEAGHLEVKKATLRIAPVNVTVKYGDQAPNDYAFGLSGYKSAEMPLSISALTGYAAPVCTSAYTKGTKAGTVDITCTGGGSSNYEFDTSAKGTITVLKQALTVTPQATSVTYGTSKPSAAFTLDGFVLGESAPGLGYQAPVCTAAAYTSATPAGSVLPVTCTGGSSTNYTFDMAATTTLTVTKAALKVVPASVSLVYGASVPTLSVSVTGWVNGQGASTAAGYVAPSCTLGYSTTTTAGVYPINCVGGSATNYTIDTTASGVLTVAKAPLTITPSSASVVYGAAKPTTTFTMSGFKNSQTAAALTAQPICSSAYVAGSGVGSYPVTCTGAASPNYTFTVANAAVTVAAAPMVVQAGSAAVTYGDAAPVYTSTVTGFVLGQSAATAGYVAPVCTSAYTPTKAVGTTAITCSGAPLANYAVTYKSGTLTINKAVLAVTPAAKSILKGSAVPTYTYTVTGFKNSQTTATVAGYTAPKCTSSYTTRSAVGSYTITCSSGAATNYSFTYGTAILKVS